MNDIHVFSARQSKYNQSINQPIIKIDICFIASAYPMTPHNVFKVLKNSVKYHS
jgi:hypothetical protein